MNKQIGKLAKYPKKRQFWLKYGSGRGWFSSSCHYCFMWKRYAGISGQSYSQIDLDAVIFDLPYLGRLNLKISSFCQTFTRTLIFRQNEKQIVGFHSTRHGRKIKHRSKSFIILRECFGYNAERNPHCTNLAFERYFVIVGKKLSRLYYYF